jgi:hypothetical protein
MRPLTRDIRVTVDSYNGSTLYDIRIYENRQGTREGIILFSDEFERLCRAHSTITKAIHSGSSFVIVLSSTEMKQTRCIGDTGCVDIREYFVYESGEVKASYKGIRLTKEEWVKLARGMT